ncbi:MAG: ABC transporter permease [Candidatus Aminicenantes bacterium]|nr:ABC transporter permease [Candidatus Aminicenantes bacterium]
MKAILAVLKKEFIQLRRDKRMAPILFISPILQLLLLGYAVNMDVRDIPSVVCDQDRTPQSRSYLDAFFHSGYFSRLEDVERPDQIDVRIDRGDAAMAMIIPRGFGERLLAGRGAVAQIIADGTESQSATIGLNYAAMITSRFSQSLLVETFVRLRGARLQPVLITPEVRVFYNPDLKSRNFLVPGVLGLILMIMTMMLSSMGIVREKETGTLEQLIVTPIRPGQIILGKLLPFLFIGVVEVVLVTSLVVFGFHIPLRGSGLLLGGMSLIFMLTTLSLGLFISTISRNQQQAMLTAVFFMIPMILLSNFVFPIETMPGFFRAVTTVVPIKYFFSVIRGIFLKGSGWAELWDEAAAMAVFGAVVLALSIARFKKRLE